MCRYPFVGTFLSAVGEVLAVALEELGLVVSLSVSWCCCLLPLSLAFSYCWWLLLWYSLVVAASFAVCCCVSLWLWWDPPHCVSLVVVVDSMLLAVVL